MLGMDADRIAQLHASLDALDAAAFAAAFAEAGTLSLANQPPARGPAAIEQTQEWPAWCMSWSLSACANSITRAGSQGACQPVRISIGS